MKPWGLRWSPAQALQELAQPLRNCCWGRREDVVFWDSWSRLRFPLFLAIKLQVPASPPLGEKPPTNIRSH